MDMNEDPWSPTEGGSSALLPVPAALLPVPVYPATQTVCHDADVASSTVNWTYKARGDIYLALRDHQRSVSKVLWAMHILVPLLVQRFFHPRLPTPALSCESEHLSRLGSYRPKDGMGLLNHININKQHINLPFPDLVAALAHQLAHLEQHCFGTPGKGRYHNREIRTKLAEIGLPCDARGNSLEMTEPFQGFLRELGFTEQDFRFKEEEMGETPVPERRRSRLQAWVCLCTKVWASVWETTCEINVVEVAATCDKCGFTFQPKERA